MAHTSVSKHGKSYDKPNNKPPPVITIFVAGIYEPSPAMVVVYDIGFTALPQI